MAAIVPEPVTTLAPALPRPHVLRQRWCDVAFLHWAVRPDAVARFFPPGVRPDVLGGWTYVGLVPFRLVGTAIGRGPAVPWAGTFLETNVRLYSVDATGRRGVVFLSLDTDRALAVAAARAVFGMPCRWARMRFRTDGDVRSYTARLRWPGARARPHAHQHSRVTVRPEARPTLDGPLEAFLTARWGLHIAHLGRTWYVPNTHESWPLQRAEVLELDDGLVASVGLGDLARRAPDHVAFSAGVAATFGAPVLRSALNNSALLRDAQAGTSRRWTVGPIQQRYRPSASGDPMRCTHLDAARYGRSRSGPS
ncbi:YqjF family protein [Pseudonocardia aurantiaca]|uniref:YqjF family protein n=1 Tax=Pseudonocardia aurantiaca TaxID=75290 RepID=A0ABW4FEZ1_9PSEU